MKFVKKRRVQKAEAAVERRAHAEHARQREIDFAKVTAERDELLQQVHSLTRAS